MDLSDEVLDDSIQEEIPEQRRRSAVFQNEYEHGFKQRRRELITKDLDKKCVFKKRAKSPGFKLHNPRKKFVKTHQMV